MKSDRKPPLAKSPMRLRTRRPLRPTNVNTPLRTPIVSTTRTQMKESDLRPEYNTISCELKALTKMVQDEIGALSSNATGLGNNSLTGNNNNNNNFMGKSLFERGRLYDAYSERRNERLRKKQKETGDVVGEPRTAYNLGVKVESTMKKDSKKNLKKTMASAVTYSVDRSEHPRYALRSTTKKPPLPPVPMNLVENTTRKTAASRTRIN